VLVLLAHSGHLLQPFDVSAASSVKTVFKQEPDKRVDRIAHGDPEQPEKAQSIRPVLVESFINALRRGTTQSNIESGFRGTGFIPFNPQVPLDSAYTIDPVDLGLFNTRVTGTERNEMVLTSPESLELLCRYEHGRNISEDDYRMELRQIWDRLRKLPVMMRRALSDPLCIFRERRS
jgi:hypothetical protein